MKLIKLIFHLSLEAFVTFVITQVKLNMIAITQRSRVTPKCYILVKMFEFYLLQCKIRSIFSPLLYNGFVIRH